MKSYYNKYSFSFENKKEKKVEKSRRKEKFLIFIAFPFSAFRAFFATFLTFTNSQCESYIREPTYFDFTLIASGSCVRVKTIIEIKFVAFWCSKIYFLLWS